MQPTAPFVGVRPGFDGMMAAAMVPPAFPPSMGYPNMMQFNQQFNPMQMNHPIPPHMMPRNQGGNSYNNSGLRGITLYIGNISTHVDNEFMRAVLDEFGKVIRWNRQSDPLSGQLAAFGFCEFADASSAGKCLTILSDMKLGGKKLKLNSNEKVRTEIARVEEERIVSMLRNFKNRSRADVEGEIKQEIERLREAVQEMIDEKNVQLPEELDESVHVTDPKEAPPPQPPEPIGGSSSVKPKRLDPEAIAAAAENSIYRIAPDGTDRRLFITEDYRPHRREIERLQQHARRLAEYEREYTKREREWMIVEEDLRKEREKEIASEMKINDQDRRLLVADDLRGQWWEGLQDERKRAERKKKRRREYEDDAADRNAELAEEEEEARKATENVKQSYSVAEEPPVIESPPQKPVHREPIHTSIQKSHHSSHKETVNPPVHKQRELKVFFGEDDEGAYGERKHKPLTRLDEHRDRTNKVQKVKETMKVIENSKRLLATVPNDNESLFATAIDWHLLNQHDILEAKLRPWVRKKVMEFMGGEEDVVGEVIDYILSRVKEQSTPRVLLEELSRFLDEEAEGFLKNMWRLLVFEQLKLRESEQ